MKKIIIISVLFIIVVAGYILVSKTIKTGDVLGIEEIKAKAGDFINNNLMQAGSEVTIKEVAEENNLYKIVVGLADGQEIISYMSKDGEKFFPQVMDIASIERQVQDVKTQPEAVQAPQILNIPKTDRPKVELFVMSHCPYGTQIEKGIIPVVELFGDKIDFELKFCDYAMHGEKELDEELLQHCIQKDEPAKLISYLKCFLENGDSQACLTQAGINTSKLNSCINTTDNQYKVKEKFKDQSTWSGGSYPLFDVNKEDNLKYGITGSPALVINGSKISSGRSPANLQANICLSFNNQPEECASSLSSTTPAPGFGYSGSGTDAGGCGE